MIAEIVSIGTELLMGQIVNTDAQYLSRRLSMLGISVYYHTTVGDNPARMGETLRRALDRSDIVITTGGLGPTGDDLSKEIVAQVLGLPMEKDEESLRDIERYFASMHRAMAQNNERQAMFAKGAVILKNDRGTAPGCIVEQDGKAVIQLPGPPYELKDMFEKRVMPYLTARTGGAIASRYIRIFGVGESDAETRVKDLIAAQGEVTIAPYCSLGEVQLRVSARGESEEDALARIAPTVEAVASRLGDAVYAISREPSDSMEHYAVDALIRAGRTVAVAESCTGGLVAARLVAIPGASAVLHESHVTYANDAKERYLGAGAAWRGIGGLRAGHGRGDARGFGGGFCPGHHRHRRAGRRYGGKTRRSGLRGGRLPGGDDRPPAAAWRRQGAHPYACIPARARHDSPGGQRAAALRPAC